MTAATLSGSRARPLKRATRIGLLDLSWLVWRQHRVLIIAISIIVLYLAGMLWWDAQDLYHSSAYPLLTMVGVPAAAGIVAVFLGAPLLSAEYESGTYLLVWSQDVSPARWLLTKIGLLSAWLIVLFGVFSAAFLIFIHRIAQGRSLAAQYGPWGSVGFEAWAPLQIVYALFGFALGIAVGVLLRRMVPAMAVTLFVFAGVRIGLGMTITDIVPPLRYTVPPTILPIVPPGQGDAAAIYGTTVDASGAPMSFPMSCYQGYGAVDTACARAHGAAATYVDYQPLSRLSTFHWIEFTIYAGLTVALFAVAVMQVRKVRVR